jgi:hypothetical protein
LHSRLLLFLPKSFPHKCVFFKLANTDSLWM